MRDITRYATDYQQNYEGFEAHQVRYRRRKVLEILSRSSHTSILEIGCGLEPLFTWAEDFASYTIVEPASVFVEAARSLAEGDPRIEIHHGCLESSVSALRSRSYEFIVASSLLHEVPDPRAFLEALRELSTRDTLVHINVPNAYSLHNLLAVEMGLIANPHEKSQLARLYQRTSTFDPASLTETVTRAGFRVVSSGSYFLKPFTHDQMQALLDREVITEAVLDAMYDVIEHSLPELGSEIYVNVRVEG